MLRTMTALVAATLAVSMASGAAATESKMAPAPSMAGAMAAAPMTSDGMKPAAPMKTAKPKMAMKKKAMAAGHPKTDAMATPMAPAKN